MAEGDGWDRLRPCGMDMSKFVKWGNVVLGALFLGAGILGFVTFFTNPGGNALRVVILIYICILGVLLALAELDFPSCTLTYFGFLGGKNGRSWFTIFTSTLCLSTGFSGNVGDVQNVVILIAGFAGLTLAILGLCYGRDEGDAERVDVASGGEFASARGRRKASASAGPDVVI